MVLSLRSMLGRSLMLEPSGIRAAQPDARSRLESLLSLCGTKEAAISSGFLLAAAPSKTDETSTIGWDP